MKRKPKRSEPSQDALGIAAEIRGRYPDLVVLQEGPAALIRGAFPVYDHKGVIDRFQIELLIPAPFPEEHPVLREVGGRIPWRLDRHMMRNGEACTEVPDDWFVLPREERTVLNFLTEPVHNYFLGQLAIEEGLEWPFGERDHGSAGLLQAYGEILDETDPEVISAYLACLWKDPIKGHLPCPCGSGRIIRKCHVEKIRSLQERVPSLIAKRAYQRLIELRNLEHQITLMRRSR